uniref:NADH-ubiquinone oxidoreductase chain 5 n=1 Tax=Chanohirata hamata TaxID=3032134 RepID=A0A7G8JRY3_9HEMI|nr:NADH dehydrogenase subunit 5 [Chanohirata hamata]QNJ33331.1 NADH dehydrogenase subunit 5 [Chanohirata hamata]
MFNLILYKVWFFILFFFSFFFLVLGFLFVYSGGCLMLEWFLFSMNSVNVVYLIYLDWISLFFCFVVLFISSMVVIYSEVYMGSCNNNTMRFLFLVLLFVLSMLLMILSPNMISIMLGWDGLGLVSYCLIIFYMSMKSYLAGMLTCLINRLGDIGLLISISWMFSYGSWNFLFFLNYYDSYIIYMIIISSFTSSAQIPFSVWLPAAMAAPTPVSSLVHSSTLVTAGVYLLIRFYHFFYFNSYIMFFMSFMTMIMSSFCANYEFDLSKIIALSTLSQLGLMMSCLFMGLVTFSFFHLLTHAMFKSLLFLCSGIMIHMMNGNQDIRFMGSLIFSMPLTCCCFNISNLALFGMPFLSGFYSKDIILEMGSFNGMNFFSLIIMYMSLGLTSFYSIRLFFYSMIYNYKGLSMLNYSEYIGMMKLSIIFLCFFSIMFGCGFMWIMSFDMGFFLLPFDLKMMSLMMIMFGLLLGYESNNFSLTFSMYWFFLNSNMWFMYSHFYYLCNFTYYSGFNLYKSVTWGEYYGSMGLSYYLIKFSNFMQFYSMSPFKFFLMSFMIWLFFMI